MKIVFVHGLLGNALNWTPILRRLEVAIADGRLQSKNWRFQSVDLLGHGKKADLAHGSSLTLGDIAEDLRREIGDEPFVGVGHSFGIRPLLHLYELMGEALHLESLIVEDSSPTISDKGFDDLRQIFEVLPERFESRRAAKEIFETAWSPRSKMPGFLLTNLVERDGVYVWRFNTTKMRFLLEDSKLNPLWLAWEKYPRRVDMIMGAKSTFVPNERIAECVARRPVGMTFVHTVENAEHWVHADQPELFINELISILNLVKAS